MVKVVTFKAKEDLIEKIDDIAKLIGVSRSRIIKRALSMYIKRIEKILKTSKIESCFEENDIVICWRREILAKKT